MNQPVSHKIKHSLCSEYKYVDNDEQDNGMTPVADKCRAQTPEDDINSDADRKKEARRNDVHTSQGVDSRRTSNYHGHK
jgi:hypothetical protein